MLRTRSIVMVLAALAVYAPLARAQSAPAGFAEEFLGQFDASTQKLVALARAMPEQSYAWSPGEGVMPVAQVYAHIARYNYHYPQANLGIAAPAGVELESMERTSSKAEVVELLERSAEHVRAAVARMPEGQLSRPTRLYGRDVQQWAVLLQLLAHMNEHLGQSIAYARMNGIVPPWSR
jgi:uncharacterized damage-inducible protein DinB